jgi:hypothetical protein
MTAIFTPNKTSARLLVDFASSKWNINEKETSSELQIRFLMVYDLYIKARSYALINKITFWLSIITGIMILVWPSLAIVTQDFGIEKVFLQSAIVQTTVTGLAALMYAIYSHYKKRQVYMENLMRQVIYSKETDQTLFDKILNEMERIDSGFSFSASIINNENLDSVGEK